MFRIEAETGKLWFVPQAGYPVLNYENPQDIGRDNIYEIRVARTATDGRVDHDSLALKVRNIVPERYEGNRGGCRNEDGELEAWYYNFTWPQVRDLINARDDWTAEEKAYAGWLLDGDAWTMPESGPLIVTWSVATEKIPEQGETVRPPASPEEVAAIRNTAKRALAEFESIINVKFIEIAFTTNGEKLGNAAMFNFYYTGEESSGGVSYSSQVTISKKYAVYSTWLHEIAHSFGISHPFSDYGQADRKPLGPDDFPRDMTGKTTGFDTVATYGNRLNRTITQHDINVLQLLYGAPGSDYRGLLSLIDDLEVIVPTPPDWL